MKKADIKVGGEYVLKAEKVRKMPYSSHMFRPPTILKDVHSGARFGTPEYTLMTRVANAVPEWFDIGARPYAKILGEARIMGTSEMGYEVETRLYHPTLMKDQPVEVKVVKQQEFVQFFKDWKADVNELLKKVKPVLKEGQKELGEAIKANEKRAKEQEAKAEKQRKEREGQADREAKLRTILNNYGINDSDGWRGVNTKQRHLREEDRYEWTTYVRHLTLDDILRLTDGKEEPPARKATRKKTTTTKKGVANG